MHPEKLTIDLFLYFVGRVDSRYQGLLLFYACVVAGKLGLHCNNVITQTEQGP